MSGRRPGQYSEVDELNRILTVERELVLKTQENYRTLKEKYLELSRENDYLKKEHEKALEGAESREKLQELEARSDELIKNMRLANEEREVRYEKFKVETIEELQNVYRKELQDQHGQIEKLRLDRMDLVKENDQLLEEVSSLNTEMDDFRRKEKAKEVEMRSRFDKKLKEMAMDNDKRVSPRFDHYEQTIESLRVEIQKKEECILEKSKSFASQIQERNVEIEELKDNETALKSNISQLEETVRDLNKQLLKSSDNTSQLEIDSLKSRNEIFLKERMDLESKMRQDHREFSRKLGEVEENFAVRIAEFQKLCEQKEGQIEELRNNLEKARKLQEDLEKSERDRQIEEEHRERLEIEVKSLYQKLQKLGDERQSSETSLKLERDRLEVSLVTLKKQLECTPEAPQNVEKLRKQLRESERRRVEEKEKRQNIVAEFQSALKVIEKRQKVTQEKLRETMAANFVISD